MVAFSKREDIEHWLKGKPWDVAVVLAARAALRGVPMLVMALGPRGGGANKVARNIVLPALRGTATPWTAARYPASTQDIAARDEAAEAAEAAAAIAADAAADKVAYGSTGRGNGLGVLYATEAALAASHAAGARHAEAASAEAADALDSAADAADQMHDDGIEIAFAAASADAEAIEHGTSAASLASQPLWPNGEPEWSRGQWIHLRRALLNLHQDWEVWTDWWEARRDGRPSDEALEIPRVLVGDDIWRQGPAVANAEIKRLIEMHDRLEQEIFDSAWTDEQKESAKSPMVPALRPAAVEPVWQKGRLTIPRKTIKTDLSEKKFVAALSSLRSELRDFVGDIGGEANIDKRFVNFVQRLAERIPGAAPSQDELFSLGHVEHILAGYSATVEQEWPDFFAARFHALVLQFERTLRQSPLWREFKRNAAKETLTPEQVASAIPLAQEAANALRSDEASEFVDRSLPNTLEQLSRTISSKAEEYPGAAIAEGNDLLAFDLIESVNNTLKPIAEVAVSAAADYAKGFGGGFKKAAKKQGPVDGVKAFRWLRRIVIGAGIGSGAAAGTFPVLSQLIAKYPQAFDWLTHVMRFLGHL
jgi:hypothetical protein